MIETRIKDIDPELIKHKIEEELKMTSFIKLPEDRGEFCFPAEEPVVQRQLYGLSYYLKQLKDPVYRRNALREFLTSQQYRKTFWFLLKRALFNKIKSLWPGNRR